jgi:phage tail protein X
MNSYTTKQGETVDQVCQRHYGKTAGVTEEVLRVNQGLAAKGAILPMGTVIKLPRMPATKTIKLQPLW